jgi:hypothetical protein
VRLHLFLEVCRAVQHAHQKGIIHRDLKPSEHPGDRAGWCRRAEGDRLRDRQAISGKITDATVMTVQAHYGHRLREPEQMEIGRADIDTRSDIYNLGVLLYELLTGQMPFDARSSHRAA